MPPRGATCESRRNFLIQLSIPAAAAVLSSCHGGQGAEPMHAPVTPRVPVAEPEPPSPAVEAVRAFELPLGAEPAIVFRASPGSERGAPRDTHATLRR